MSIALHQRYVPASNIPMTFHLDWQLITSAKVGEKEWIPDKAMLEARSDTWAASSTTVATSQIRRALSKHGPARAR